MTNNTKVIILAAGKSTRFNGVIKQLLPIGRDTILGRMIKQCHLLGYDDPTIMVRSVADSIKYMDYTTHPYIAEKHDTTCDTILSSQPLWGDRTIVLLGDVIYSPEVINSIFKYTGEFSVWGNSWEIFAMSFSRKVWYDLIVALEKGSKYKLGKIRYMYKYYIGIEPDKKEIDGTPPGPHFVYTHDWTRDIDMQQEYSDTILQLVNTHILDNKYV